MTTTSTIDHPEQAAADLLGGDVDAVRQMGIGDLARVLTALGDDVLQTLSRAEAEVVVAATQRVANVMAAIQAEAITTFADETERRLDELERERRRDYEERRDAAERRGERFTERWHPIPGGQGFAAAELAPLLHVSPRSMATRVTRARRLVWHLPGIRAMARRGELEPWRTEAVVRAGEVLEVADLEELEARVLATDVRDISTAELRRRARRAAAATDPKGFEEMAQRARARRGVGCGPDPDLPGLTTWTLRLPTDVSALVWSAVDALGREHHAARREAGDPVTLDQARADALADLVLSRADITTTLELVVPVAALATGEEGIGAAPGIYHQAERSSPSEILRRSGTTDPLILSWVEGRDLHLASVVEAEVALMLMGHLEVTGNPHLTPSPPGTSLPPDPDRPPDADPPPDPARPHDAARPSDGDRWPRTSWFVPGLVEAGRVGELLPQDISAILADPDTRIRLLGSGGAEVGQVVTDATTAYRPGQTLANRVRRRDGACRFPGCGTPAGRCQLDHVEPWPEGETTDGNLVALCVSHHGFKHHAGWRLSMTADGTCTWTAPTGRTHVTRPRAVHDPAT